MSKSQVFQKAGMVLVLVCGFIFPGTVFARQILHGQRPLAVSYLSPTGRLPASARLDLGIGLPLRNQDKLNRLLRQLYDPASPDFRHYLTPSQFTEQFGPTEQDYQALIDFAQANGLTVTATYPNRELLDVNGSVAEIERVFHVTLRTYWDPRQNRTFYAPDVEPSFDLTVPVLHISGLDNYFKPRPMFVKVIPMAERPGVTADLGSGPSGSYMGNDFRAAYVPDVSPSLNGAGQSIALLELDGYYPNDIRDYEMSNGLPNVTLTNILVDEASAPPGAGNSEVALDIEMAIAMAPGISNVMVYQGPNPGTSLNLLHLLQQIATDNVAKQISSSWSIGDDPNFDTVYLQYATQGQSFFQSSGDNDAYYPGIPQSADATNITLVGGTTLYTSGPGGSWQSETVWNWGGGSGSGGGISLNGYSLPYWQQGINMTTNHGSTSLRNVPDVALTADNIFIIADNGTPKFVGGTSAAAPLWAAFTALVNQQAKLSGQPPVGFINPAIYAIGKGAFYGSDFHDITTGNNTNAYVPNNYYAVPGYDLCTGWGTPRGLNLITALATPDTLGILPGSGFSSSGTVGGPFSITSQNFSLTNNGGASLSWSVLGTPAWLNVVPDSGTLASGAGTTVAVSLHSPETLPEGTYTATLLFSNQTSHVVQPRQFSLTVHAANLVQNGGFEAGLSFISWTVNNNDGYNYVDNGYLTSGVIAPHSGTNFAAFGQYSGDGLCTISQTLPTVAGQEYLISYWWESVDFGYGTVPNELKVTWNGTTQLDQYNAGVVGWTNQRLLVTATGVSSTLSFGLSDDYAFLVLDDISVSPVSAPVFHEPTLSGGNINLSWNTTAGVKYLVQYRTNLTQGVWSNLTDQITATNTMTTTSNLIGTDPQRFYRVQMITP